MCIAGQQNTETTGVEDSYLKMDKKNGIILNSRKNLMMHKIVKWNQKIY